MAEDNNTPSNEQNGEEETQDKKTKPTNKERLTEEIRKRIEESKELQQKSIDLHKQADEEDDPDKAGDLHHEAAQLDKKAATLLKTARRLEKGWMQGGATGGGIGAGVAGGLGTVIGSVVGGVVAIPSTGLGILIGAGTGLVHGPWVKFTDKFTKDDEEEMDRDAEEDAQSLIDADTDTVKETK